MLLPSRAATWTAALTASLAAGALVVAMPPAHADIGADLSYACATPSGMKSIKVHVGANAPAKGKPGKPIRLGSVRVAVTIPESAVNDVLGPAPSASPGGAPMVSGSLQLAVAVSQNGVSAEALWPEFPVNSEPQGDGGAVRVRASGEVPSVTPGTQGNIALTAGTLVLAVTRNAAGNPASQVKCAPDRDGTLAVVPVAGERPGKVTPTPNEQRPISPAMDPDYEPPPCDELPVSPFNPDPKVKREKPLYDAVESDPAPGGARCALISGFINASKLGGAAPIGGDTQLRIQITTAQDRQKNYTYKAGYALVKAEPSTATLLGFGFMPTTATTITNQIVTPDSGGSKLANYAYHASDKTRPAQHANTLNAKSFVEAKISQVNVNGALVDVGDNCKSSPIRLDVTTFNGNDRTGRVEAEANGRYQGKVDVESFSGCGTGEDLSPLLKATISAPDNFVRIDQGAWCEVGNPRGPCQFGTAIPGTWTVSRGGKVTATAKPFSMKGNVLPGGFQSEIRCESAELTLKFRKGAWQRGFRLGDLEAADFNTCERTAPPAKPGDPPKVIKQEVTAEGLPGSFTALNSTDGRVNAQISGIFIDSKGADGCNVRISGASARDEIPLIAGGIFDNKTQIWKPSASLFTSPKSPCKPPGMSRMDVSHNEFKFNPPRIEFTSP